MRFALLLVLVLVLGVADAYAGPSVPLVISTSESGKRVFHVLLATTPEEQERGLMFQPAIPADSGMLFDFHRVQAVQMWMKNTLIPLDMLFIAEDGRIVGIANRTVPKSLDIIAAPRPVRAVLEINGGTCEQLQIKVGDRVTEPTFDAPSPPASPPASTGSPDTAPPPRSSGGPR